MNQIEISFITNRLNVLTGTKVAEINRKYDDIWIEFVDETEKCYVLLMQTLFRFCDTEKVLVTDIDKYKISDSISSDPLFDDEIYDWDVQGNIFDEWVQNNKPTLLRCLVVKDIKLDISGDLIILFNDDISLTVYLEVTNDKECWRFFEKDADESNDIIVLGNGIKVNL